VKTEPLEILATRVRPEWLDYNKHMNAGYYAVAYNEAIKHFLETIGMGESLLRDSVGTAFALECHITYLRELQEGDPIRITAQLLDYDRKRFHFFLRMHHAEKCFMASTYEQISLFVAISTRRAALIPPSALEKLERLLVAHRRLPKPPQVGGSIKM
jgi:acyl-CoA thioester hydrolase